jgi:sulfonate transport system substrate-binding protein
MLRWVSGIVVALLAAMPSATKAEVRQVVLGQQFGSLGLPLMVMEHKKLVEKHLAAKGMADVAVVWARLGGPAAMNDAILSGSLHFSAQGVPSLAVLWDRTRGGLGVKAMDAIAANNFWLNTRNPAIRSLKDFTDRDRIAIPSLKVSTQAVLLTIGAEKLWGKERSNRLDHIIVQLPQPEAMAAVINPISEITAHFATTPFHEAEIKAGVHNVTTAKEIMGDLPTGLMLVTTTKFRSENPTVYAAVAAALDEALAWIAADHRAAARLYLELTKDKTLTEVDMMASLTSGDLAFEKAPRKVGEITDFMFRTGMIKVRPESWKDLFFPEAHGLAGS